MNGAGTARWLAGAAAMLAALMLAVPQVAAAAELSIVTEEPIVGHELNAAYDMSTDPTTLEWVRCEGDKPPCSTVVGTGASYVIAAADLGNSLAVGVAGGEVRSSLTAPVYAIRPDLTNVAINGTALVGELLTADVGVTGDPAPVLEYQWFRCSGDPLDCTEAIPDATAATYRVAPDDGGHRLSLTVKATNLVDTAVRSALTAQQAPAVTSVTIAGTAIVGQRLTARATATGVPAPAITFQWLRCGPLLPPACDPIDGGTGTSYDVTPADAGFRLAVRARAENSADAATDRSSLTDVVPDPPDSGSTFDRVGTPPTLASTPVAGTPGVPSARLRYMRPFPVVRIKGLLVAGGAQVTLLRVTAPRGSKVVVRCRRPGCPLRRAHPAVGRLRPFERFLPAGVRITIRVWRPGRIGKHVRIRIRDGKAPARRDSCVLPGRKRATTCPLP
jgi:hypothetical protein